MLKKTPLALKKSVAAVALAASLATTGGIVAVNTAMAATAMVATTNVNLRSGPGTSYSVVTVVPSGATVQAESTGSYWTAVTYGGKTGYISSRYLTAASGTTAGEASGSATANASVNVRSGPSTSYAVVGVATEGTEVPTTGATSGSWVQVIWNGRNAWIYGSYLTVTDSYNARTTTPQIVGQARTTATLNLRTEGYYGASVATTVPANTVLDLTGEKTSTYSQVYFQGRLLWGSTSYLASTDSSTTPTVSTPATTSEKQQKLVDWAYAQVGKDYLWGGEGPNAYDCSGFVMKAYEQVGISLPHYSGDQAKRGTAVSYSDLKPGDVIAWYNPVQHVSMYVGDGKMIHARNSKYGVVVQSVAEYKGWAPIATIRRFI